MNKDETRVKLIDPKLKDYDWGVLVGANGVIIKINDYPQ